MDIKTACKILGVTEDSTKKEIKARYRQLIRDAHPDAIVKNDKETIYNAQEINEAYEVLSKGTKAVRGRSSASKKADQTAGKTVVWEAPSNDNAYTERDIYHSVEGIDGESIGSVTVATGKYYWTLDEDFSDFLKSIYECAKKLLDEIDDDMQASQTDEKRMKYHAELAYLLAQQFIDISNTLKQLVPEKRVEGASIFRIPAMVELDYRHAELAPGMSLYPMGITNHKLMLKSQKGKKVGYLSLADDRLYYIVIPLIEMRQVQVKVEVVDRRGPKKPHRRNVKYADADFYIKILDDRMTTYPESLNIRIENLLNEYKKG